MQNPGRAFFGKIMLFGEYSVICQGRALTVPLNSFRAIWKLPSKRYSTEEAALNQELKDYLLTLVRREENEGINFGIDLNVFALDLLRGLFLDSDIPRGYGVGSSGALVASVYDRYAPNPIPTVPFPGSKVLKKLQKTLALLESHFHGTSSGLDPLSCYVGRPLLIDPDLGPKTVTLPSASLHELGGFFLADTHLQRRTEGLVKAFLRDYQDAAFHSMIHDMYIPVVDFCIDALLEGHPDELLRGFRQLSSMQLHHFRPMIPRGFEEMWEEGLETGQFYLKLCGAGGGGFLLGYTENFYKTRKIFKQAGISLMPISLPV
ncbi:MAG: hypothetical protein V2I46_00260 [Bacteroides sp.]|jgi:mevalonate kinase|nr:hypothetical protein [Bacteroides sp.]